MARMQKYRRWRQEGETEFIEGLNCLVWDRECVCKAVEVQHVCVCVWCVCVCVCGKGVWQIVKCRCAKGMWVVSVCVVCGLKVAAVCEGERQAGKRGKGARICPVLHASRERQCCVVCGGKRGRGARSVLSPRGWNVSATAETGGYVHEPIATQAVRREVCVKWRKRRAMHARYVFFQSGNVQGRKVVVCVHARGWVVQ